MRALFIAGIVRGGHQEAGRSLGVFQPCAVARESIFGDHALQVFKDLVGGQHRHGCSFHQMVVTLSGIRYPRVGSRSTSLDVPRRYLRRRCSTPATTPAMTAVALV